MSLGRLLWMWAWRLAIAALIMWQLKRFQGTNAMIVFVLMIPVIGVLMASPILESLASWFNWARKQPYEKWQGNYYEFANIQIRIIEDGGGLWFCDADVFQVLGISPAMAASRISLFQAHERRYFSQHKLHAFSEDGVKRLLAKSQHRESRPMLLWIEREVLKPHRRKIELRDMPPPEADPPTPADAVAPPRRNDFLP
jgi:hypothetical protein